MTAKLTLRYEFSSDPNDDFGWLALAVETDRFTGRGGFWVQWQDVTEMAPKLDAYPFSSEHPFVEEWGHCDSDGANYEVIVGISILPANKTGDLDVIVKIADHIDRRRQCQAVFRTNYPDTANFASELRAMMGRQRHNAVLLGRNVSYPPNCGRAAIIYDRCMRTIHTDRYAVQIWLPLLIGGASLWLWSDDPGASVIQLATGIFWLIYAAMAIFKRYRRLRFAQ